MHSQNLGATTRRVAKVSRLEVVPQRRSLDQTNAIHGGIGNATSHAGHNAQLEVLLATTVEARGTIQCQKNTSHRLRTTGRPRHCTVFLENNAKNQYDPLLFRLAVCRRSNFLPRLRSTSTLPDSPHPSVEPLANRLRWTKTNAV